MRTSIILSSVVLAVAFAVAGCRIEAHTQTKFVGSPPVAQEATKDYAGEQIVVVNENGNVIVRGDSSATKVSLSAKVFAFADDDKQADAQQARDSVKTTITI